MSDQIRSCNGDVNNAGEERRGACVVVIRQSIQPNALSHRHSSQGAVDLTHTHR